jgi:hypothetical protein
MLDNTGGPFASTQLSKSSNKENEYFSGTFAKMLELSFWPHRLANADSTTELYLKFQQGNTFPPICPTTPTQSFGLKSDEEHPLK